MEPAAPDIVLINGDVYTVDPQHPWAEAIAIRQGRIEAVGTTDEIRDLADSRTQIWNCAGRMVLPGFQDSHCHPPASGRDLLRCYLGSAADREGYLALIKEYATSNPDKQWIQGGGWAMAAFPGGTPTKEDLDSVVPDRPAFFTNRDGHGAWVNSRALELAGITAGTADPSDGRIERTPAGEPSGVLHEGAMDLAERLTPATTDEELRDGMLIAQRHLHSLGITAWQDAIVGEDMWGDTLGLYIAMGKSGELTARVVGALWLDREAGEDQIPGLVAHRAAAEDAGKFRATSVKIMQDGVLENFTGSVLEPYLASDGKPTDNRGISFFDPELLNRLAPRLDAEGFQLHFHAIGDRAVRQALDAIQTALEANGPNDHRHHISHIQLIHPNDIPRFARLGVIANAQPYWAAHEGQMDELTIPFIGRERATWQYPFASLKAAGARLAFGSDWDVSTANPLEEMEVAVMRVDPEHRDHGPFYPEERVDLATAIEAFTMGTAYVNHLDDDTGSVTAGKFADIAIIDRNLFQDAEHIADARVVRTLVEGETVFADATISLGE